MSQFSSLFHPQSLAIIGISRKTPSLGRMILNNLEESQYNGDIYLVNPKADTIGSYKVHNQLDSLPDDLDLAIILTPPKFVPQTLQQLSGRCKFASIISAGFNNALTEEILSIANSGDIRIVGPNSMGTYAHNVSASFSPIPITTGSLAYISQSGSIIAVVQELMTGNFGFSKFISLGNKIDITENDMFKFIATDTSSTVIAGYLESFSNPSELKNILLSITPYKPVILVKGGRTNEGSHAVSSHTGALAGNYRLTESLLNYCGVITVKTIDEQIAIARFIDKFGVNPHTGIVTISSAGGPGVLAADEIVETGLDLAKLEENTMIQLQEVIPPFGNYHNPLDLVADAGIDRYVNTVNIIKNDPNVSTIIVIIVHPVLIDTEPLLAALDALDLPIIIAYLGSEYSIFDNYKNLIIYQTTKEIVNILVTINSYASWKKLSLQKAKYAHLSPNQNFENELSKSILENLLKSYGFTFPKTIKTNEYNHAKKWFENLQQSVVLKLSHDKFSHKTDIGGVILNISSINELENAWNRLDHIYQTANIEKMKRIIEIQPYYSDGIEVVLGIIFDEQFGHFILIGTGGTMVELLDDTIFLPTPVTRDVVKNAIRSLKLQHLLHGFRGGKAVNIEKLVDQILQLDNLIYHHPEIIELDLNPLYVVPEKSEFVILDARFNF